MRLGSTEHYGWDDWFAVSVRHVFAGDEAGGTSYAWLEGPRGPRGASLSVLVTARTPPRGWREPAAGQSVDVWAWPVSGRQREEWSAALGRGEAPRWRDPGTPEQWLQVREDSSGAAAGASRHEKARMFRGLTFRGRAAAGGDVLRPGQELTSATGVTTSADLRVATRNLERHSLWCLMGDEGRIVDDRPGLPALREVFFLPGTRFRTSATWRDQVGDYDFDVVLVHQLDSVRGPDHPSILEPSRVPALVRVLMERARDEAPLRLRDEGRFIGPLV